MSGKPKQKQKILFLLRILFEHTDGEHAMTLAELSEELARQGIESERKSLYRDLEALNEAGFSVGVLRSRDVRYYWKGYPLNRKDHLLLSNLLRAAQNVPRKRKHELEGKLRGFASQTERDVCYGDFLSVIPDRAVSERVYSNAEFLFDAVLSGKKVRFVYKGSALRDMTPRRRNTSSVQLVSPYRLVWCDGYFLVGADGNGEISFYRISRMEELTLTDVIAEDIREIGGDLDFDLEQYIKGYFASLQDPEHMIFRVSESFLPMAERRFDSDSVIESAGTGFYLLTCDAPADEDLFGWLLLHSEDISLLYPESLVSHLRSLATACGAVYKNNDAAE